MWIIEEYQKSYGGDHVDVWPVKFETYDDAREYMYKRLCNDSREMHKMYHGSNPDAEALDAMLATMVEPSKKARWIVYDYELMGWDFTIKREE